MYYDYNDDVDDLRFSDHSPVSCTYEINLPIYCNMKKMILEKRLGEQLSE